MWRVVRQCALLGWLGMLALAVRWVRALAAPGPRAAGRALPLCAAAVLGFALLGAVLVLAG